MTVKLLLLKSGEDIVADVKEMVVGDEENPRVVGYFLTKPCVVKMKNHNQLPDVDDNRKVSSFDVSFYPWVPMTKDSVVPIGTDWVVTMTNPIDKLNNMYTKNVLNYGNEDNQDSGSDERSDSDITD